MSNILVLRTAATGSNSFTNRLIDIYLARQQGALIVERDLDKNPPPHVTSENLAGIGRHAAEGAGFAAARVLQDELIAEVFAADIVVIGLPLYNLGMPSTLKSWFDYVARAGTTFNYTEAGVQGLITGKRLILFHARGGRYDDATGFPFALAHTKSMLGFMGMTDVSVVTAEGIAFGEDAAAAAMDKATEQIAAL
jgi:FMN-dependent NADH-azoreductase